MPVEGDYNIKLKADSHPTIQPQRNVPLRLRDKLKATRDDLERKDIITKVEEPVDWVSNLVIVEKPNNTLRLCLDPPDLNQAREREDFKPPSLEMISNTLNGCKVFSVVDIAYCYWHQKLTEKSSFLCTFNSPFGRYRFKRMPFGISCASEVAQKMVEKHFGDISGALPVFDDIITGGKNEQEHDLILREENVISSSTVTKSNFVLTKSSTWVKLLANWDFHLTQKKFPLFITCLPLHANKTYKGY